MCLQRVDKPKQKIGIGWKMVKPTNVPGVYRPCWIYFDEIGGLGDTHGYSSMHKVSINYQVGKVTKSDAPKDVLVGSNCRYKPGIHVFLNKPSSGTHDGVRLICLRVEYRGAYATDDSQVVCTSVKVLKVVRARKIRIF